MPFFSNLHRPGLFRSNAWLEAWLSSWGDHPGLKAVGDINQSNLDGVLFSCSEKVKNVFPVQTLFPLGIQASVAPSIRSEYFCVSSESLVEHKLTELFSVFIDSGADQLYVPDVLEQSVEWHVLFKLSRVYGFASVIKERSCTYGVSTAEESFQSYLASLGGNTRLKLFNRRKNLAALGTVTITNVWPDQSGFYDLLNSFHQLRWGKSCYADRNLKFMTLLLNNLNRDGYQIDLSVMSVDGQPVSVVLDVLVNGRTYNLQSGYIENFSKNISLGTLHFGYQIEAAFLNPDVDFYDFMAGSGKHSNYKAALANKEAVFNTFMLVRNPFLKWMYKFNTWLNQKSGDITNN